MTVTHLLIGCTLALGGVAGASATTVDTQALATSQRVVVDAAGPEGGGSLAPGPAHDSSVPDQVDAPSHSSDASAPGSVAHPQVTRRSLGWQSLLPGSIQ